MIKINSIERKNNSAHDLNKLAEEESKFLDQDTAACTSDSYSDDMEAFMNYSPRYRADDFEKKVCYPLKKIAESYEQSAQRYEEAIKVTERTIKKCEYGIAKIERSKKINSEMLNEGFRKIATDIAFQVAAEDQ